MNVRQDFNLSNLNLSKKSSLRPSNSQLDGSPEYLSASPEKSSPEKPSASNKIFKGAINKYQAHIVEENDDEEENDIVEENASPMKLKSGFYEGTSMENMSQSLANDAKEKQMFMKQRGLEKKMNKFFKNSQILNEKEAVGLYLNLPGVLSFDTELIFTMAKDKSFEIMEKNLAGLRCPIIVILGFGGEKFGGYASECWDLQKQRFFFLFFSLIFLSFILFRNFGDKTCFLFNLRKDAKILPMKTSNSWLFSNGNGVFGFGGTDLVFQNDFERCSSELESCFSYSFQQKSEDSKCFLAGTMIFKPDSVEIWALTQEKNGNF